MIGIRPGGRLSRLCYRLFVLALVPIAEAHLLKKGEGCLADWCRSRMAVMSKTALVVGASGIIGSATAELLVEEGWSVYGLARRPAVQAGVQPVTADLHDARNTAAALAKIRPDAVFITTWAR